MTRQNKKILKVPFTLFMGTQYGPIVENFFDFFKKISLTLVMGSEIIKTAERILKFLQKISSYFIYGVVQKALW